MVIRFNTFVSLLVYASISTLSMFVYYYSVYGFCPFCLHVAVFLVNDFLVWFDREVFLDCFCAYLPSLSKEPGCSNIVIPAMFRLSITAAKMWP